MQKIPGGKVQRHILLTTDSDKFLRQISKNSKISQSKMLRKILNYLQYKNPQIMGDICDF